MIEDSIRGEDIVCLGFADWETELWTNQHHLMSRLAERNRVLFIESLGLRRPQFASSDFRRILRRLDRTFGGLRAVDDLHVISPPVIPLHSSAAVRSLNAVLLRWAVGRATERLGMHDPILWAYAPQAEAIVERIRPSVVLYHCVDDLAAHKGVDPESFRAVEQRFAARANLVIASSPPLADRMRRVSRNVLEAPNVADVEVFASALEPGPVDPGLAALPCPRIVFTGAVVATKLDFDLIVGLARARREWSIALVGPVGTGDPSTDVAPLEAEPNVYLLGRRHYRELPNVLRGADIGLIPYAPNDLTRSVFPMKVHEYLGAGLPIVATSLPSLRAVDDITFVNDPAAMAEAIEAELAKENSDRRAERSRRARGRSWEARLTEIAAALEASGDSRTGVP
jgi:glycosyltransferase involved in cell wall biosynthesis